MAGGISAPGSGCAGGYSLVSTSSADWPGYDLSGVDTAGNGDTFVCVYIKKGTPPQQKDLVVDNKLGNTKG